MALAVGALRVLALIRDHALAAAGLAGRGRGPKEGVVVLVGVGAPKIK